MLCRAKGPVLLRVLLFFKVCLLPARYSNASKAALTAVKYARKLVSMSALSQWWHQRSGTSQLGSSSTPSASSSGGSPHSSLYLICTHLSQYTLYPSRRRAVCRVARSRCSY